MIYLSTMNLTVTTVISIPLMIEIYRVRVKIVFRPNFALITNTCTVATTTS